MKVLIGKSLISGPLSIAMFDYRSNVGGGRRELGHGPVNRGSVGLEEIRLGPEDHPTSYTVLVRYPRVNTWA